MIFRQHFPQGPLAAFVDNMVFYENYIPEHQFEKLLPDGSIFLLIDLQEGPKKCVRSEDFGVFETFERSYVSGQHRGFIYIESTYDSSMMVVQFKPGGAAPFFKNNISEMNDCVKQSEVYFGDELNLFRDELIAEADVDSRFRMMENFLLDRMQVPQGLDRLTAILKELKDNPNTLTTAEMATLGGMSQKHLISLFDKYVGHTPKALARIFRFQKVLHQIEADEAIDWMQIVSDCGYYDQSHFVKDFYEFSGINPGKYPDARGEYLNYIPVK